MAPKRKAAYHRRVFSENPSSLEAAGSSSGDGLATNRSESRGDQTILEIIPEEIILRIFSSIEPLELIRCAGPTCKRTLELSRFPDLWRRLRLDGSIESPTVASRLVDMAGVHLRTLEIAERRDAADLVQRLAATSSHQLKSLSLRRIPDRFPARVLLKILRKHPGLKSLVLRDVRRIRSKVFFQQLGSRVLRLSCLDVGHCPQFGTSALAAVANSGLALRELRAFRDSGYRSTMPHATDEDFCLFCSQMKDSICVIKINASSLTDESCIIVSKCIHLHTLHLRDAKCLTVRGIMEIVTHLPTLTSLDLSGAIQLSSANWAEAFVGMVSAPKIEVLKLKGCCGIDDIAAQWMKFPSLHHLCLADCFLLGEDGFCAVITGCANLRYLDLHGTAPGFSRCLHLLPVYTPQLELLVFPTNECPIVLLEELLSRMRHLKISDSNEPNRINYWRTIAVDEELRRLNDNQVAE